MCSPLAWQYLLPYCCVIVALLLSILLCVYLNRQIALVSDYQAKLMAASPAKPRRKPISTVINGRSPGTSTHRSLRILLPGYPPTSKLEVEGSEIRKQVEHQENVSSQTSDSVSYQKTDTGSSNEYTQQESQKKTESGTGIERSIAIGIILLSIIIGIILYVRSHTSK